VNTAIIPLFRFLTHHHISAPDQWKRLPFGPNHFVLRENYYAFGLLKQVSAIRCTIGDKPIKKSALRGNEAVQFRWFPHAFSKFCMTIIHPRSWRKSLSWPPSLRHFLDRPWIAQCLHSKKKKTNTNCCAAVGAQKILDGFKECHAWLLKISLTSDPDGSPPVQIESCRFRVL
jgi:hypothetical protein